MLDILVERLRQKKRTVPFPGALPALPLRFRGRPFIDASSCIRAAGGDCAACAKACPTEAVHMEDRGPALDMGACTFCGACAAACPAASLVFTTDWRLASTERAALFIRPLPAEAHVVHDPMGRDKAMAGAAVVQSFPPRPERTFVLPELPLAPTREAAGAFARSCRLRQVTAAGCGACEADLNVLGTVVFDIARFGLDFVASPRHADAMVLTGPVPRNMREATLKCLAAMPEPKLIMAVGACAISGGLFRSLPDEGQEEGDSAFPGRPQRQNPQRAEGALPHMGVGLFIPGCPPHPYTSLDGFLRFIGRTTPSSARLSP
ncbi:4Fe-4S dicluster domain-containing protein [Desulfovibrio sp. OttesenSCG-928-A18]|nr:4Fe-4S dicluster domain-containing protein [Desulfovibrio sp. OttesenSCG-928-A18]